MIADNINSVRQRIAKCCEKAGRPADSVTLVCVTKGIGLAEISEALAFGVTTLGENRIQEALSKYSSLGDRADWHLVGHLQTNKAKDAVSVFSLIQSIDSIRIAKEVDKEAKKIDKIQDILIEVNTSQERTKFGISPDDAVDFVKEVSSHSNINIRGLMTIAPEVTDPEAARPYFRVLRNLRDKVNSLKPTAYSLQLLSMGMSNDFEVAIEEGSNMVRIGRAIFSV